MNAKPYTVAIILAAGSGSRFSADKTKQKTEILGKTVLEHCALAFDNASLVDEIVVVYKSGEEDFVRSTCRDIKKKCTLTQGGATRAESARLGFESVSLCDTVLIHDAARCLILPEQIDEVARRAYECGAASASSIITDTVKTVRGGKIVSTVSRDTLLTVQTPQAFDANLYRRALEKTGTCAASITDDNMLVEALGIPIEPVMLGKENIKITHKDDLVLAEYILKKRSEG